MNVSALRQRAAVVSALREWFSAHGYVEVHTPVIVNSGAMETHIEPVRVGTLHLHTSPEFAMKRVLAAGLPRIYQIGPCFREEEIGVHHSREFTMLEWYRAGAGTWELMAEVEGMIQSAAEAVGVPSPEFRRVPISNLISDTGSPDDWFHRWVSEVEPSLTEPTFVYDYPEWQSALARVRNGKADRFEVYLGGIELGNAFAEETSGMEIRQRWIQNNKERKQLGKPLHPLDESFLAAVDRLPRCAGMAIGLDRLVMALCGLDDIREVQV